MCHAICEPFIGSQSQDSREPNIASFTTHRETLAKANSKETVMSTWAHNISAYLRPMVISPIWLFISQSIFGQYSAGAGSAVAIIVVSYNSVTRCSIHS